MFEGVHDPHLNRRKSIFKTHSIFEIVIKMRLTEMDCNQNEASRKLIASQMKLIEIDVDDVFLRSQAYL